MHIVKLAAAALAALVLQLPATAAGANHKTAASCGYHSGNFARTCSATSTTRCLAAAKRGAPGITKSGCDKHRAVCSSCLMAFQRRVKKAEAKASPTLKASCGTCARKFERCMEGT